MTDPIAYHMDKHRSAKYRVIIESDNHKISIAFNDIDKGLKAIKKELQLNQKGTK
jgi:hypothetical protein